MNIAADAPFVSRPASRFAAGLLALGVHALFALLLVFGVSWQTLPPAPVTVDLWEALPAPPPKSRPAPAPVPVPKPAVSEPPPEKPLVNEPPPPKAPDIALEKKQAAEDRVREEAVRAAAEAREKARVEQQKRERLRQMEEAELIQQMAEEEAAIAARQTRMAEARAAASRRQAAAASVVGEYRDRISSKVRSNIRLPDLLNGNPEVRCLVRLLPTGEVQSVQVTRSSGIPAYDDAVVRAIEKSSPLPLPPERDARAAFVPELFYSHRPKE